MISRLFPETADNTYLGHPIARWLLTFYVVKSFVAGSIHMFASDGGAQSIASITLGDFCLLYTSPSPRDRQKSRMPSSA